MITLSIERINILSDIYSEILARVNYGEISVGDVVGESKLVIVGINLYNEWICCAPAGFVSTIILDGDHSSLNINNNVTVAKNSKNR